MTAACTRYSPALFDSTEYRQHVKARAICASCPLVAQCLATALSIAAEYAPTSECLRGPDGTWAGLLWVNGAVQTMPYRAVEEVAA